MDKDYLSMLENARLALNAIVLLVEDKRADKLDQIRCEAVSALNVIGWEPEEDSSETAEGKHGQ